MDVAQLGRRLYTALDAHDWDEVYRIAHPDLLVQVDSFPPMGLEQWRAGQQAFHQGFPDGRHVIEHELISDDHLVTRCRYEGIHRGEFAGVAPTSAAVSVRVIHIDRFDGDRLVEHRGQLDMLGLLAQIGASPA